MWHTGGRVLGAEVYPRCATRTAEGVLGAQYMLALPGLAQQRAPLCHMMMVVFALRIRACRAWCCMHVMHALARCLSGARPVPGDLEGLEEARGPVRGAGAQHGPAGVRHRELGAASHPRAAAGAGGALSGALTLCFPRLEGLFCEEDDQLRTCMQLMHVAGISASWDNIAALDGSNQQSLLQCAPCAGWVG